MSKKPAGNLRKLDFRVLGRVLKLLFASYPVLIPLTVFCIVFSAVVASIPSIFTQKVLAIVTQYTEAGMMDWADAKAEILPKVLILIGLYII
jgi:ATP-binding cassette subfamily B protein